MAQLLDSDEVRQQLETHREWSLKGKEIQREFKFDDFRDAMRFVNHVAEAAEKVDHHPDILISYNRVKLTLSTHSAGGLTQKDFDLARDIDFLV